MSPLSERAEFNSSSRIPRRSFLNQGAKCAALISLVYGGFRSGCLALDDEFAPLFDGKSLKGWKKSEFSGGNDVRVEDGVIIVEAGEELCGFQVEGKFPTDHYEFEVEAQRRSGLDFFCTITFPVRDRFLSLVIGGWGGSTIGLSSIDHHDASANETTSQRQFKDKVWYRIRLRVSGETIQAWIDNERVVNLDTTGKELSLRPGEIEISCPFGISTFRTEAAFRNLRLKRLSHPSP
ncbi:MAG: DUF1080 domain-containing protein [Verrucomicrobiota bacterium]